MTPLLAVPPPHERNELLTISPSLVVSRLYGSMEKRIVDIFRNQAVAQNLHQLGLPPDLYARTPQFVLRAMVQWV